MYAAEGSFQALEYASRAEEKASKDVALPFLEFLRIGSSVMSLGHEIYSEVQISHSNGVVELETGLAVSIGVYNSGKTCEETVCVPYQSYTSYYVEIYIMT